MPKQKRKNLSPNMEELMPHLIKVWRRLTKEGGPPDQLQTREFRKTVAAIDFMRESLDYQDDPRLLAAYLLYYWPLHYQQALSIFGELPFIPHRVLDLGSGPAPMAFAALRHGAADVVAADINEQALELGAEICGRYGYPLTLLKKDLRRIPSFGNKKYDAIIIGHTLFHNFPDPKEAADYLNNLQALLNPDGFLLIIDRSEENINHKLLELRDLCVESGWPIQAPCVWKGKCVAREANSVCYAQRPFEKSYLISEIQRSANIKLNSLKMSYLILRHPKCGWPQLPQERLYRIVSPPFEATQGTSYYLCGIDGKKKLCSNLDEHPPSSRPFEYLKRGELISVDKPLESGNTFEIDENTQIVNRAPLGKPLPLFEERDG